MDESHDGKGGSYVINRDGTRTLKERGAADVAVNTATVRIPEHEEAQRKAKAQADAQATAASVRQVRRGDQPADAGSTT